jgi:hypothetical protein
MTQAAVGRTRFNAWDKVKITEEKSWYVVQHIASNAVMDYRQKRPSSDSVKAFAEIQYDLNRSSRAVINAIISLSDETEGRMQARKVPYFYDPQNPTSLMTIRLISTILDAQEKLVTTAIKNGDVETLKEFGQMADTNTEAILKAVILALEAKLPEEVPLRKEEAVAQKQ